MPHSVVFREAPCQLVTFIWGIQCGMGDGNTQWEEKGQDPSAGPIGTGFATCHQQEQGWAQPDHRHLLFDPQSLNEVCI